MLEPIYVKELSKMVVAPLPLAGKILLPHDTYQRIYSKLLPAVSNNVYYKGKNFSLMAASLPVMGLVSEAHIR